MATPHTYAHLYDFFRERREAGPDPLLRYSKADRMLFGQRSPGHGREAGYWGPTCGDETRLRRCYSTQCGFTVYHPDTVFHGGYEWMSPTNAVSFATTGIEGCHFSFILTAEGEWSADCPVVMTVPDSHLRVEGNVIVGANLWEFLGLGVRLPFDWLYELYWRPEAFLKQYPDHDADEDSEAAALARRFGLVAWERDAIRPRLAALREEFFRRLVFPPDG